MREGGGAENPRGGSKCQHEACGDGGQLGLHVRLGFSCGHERGGYVRRLLAPTKPIVLGEAARFCER